MSVTVKVFIWIKLVQFVILYLVPVKFDTSSDNYLRNSGLNNQFLNNFVVWDNVYFTKLFNTDDVVFEHESVFSPMLTYWIRSVPGSFYFKLCLGVVVSNISHFITCIMVKNLSLRIFPKDYKTATMASVMCALSTGGVFLTMSYSESFCALLTVGSILLREKSITYQGKNYKIRNWFYYLVSGMLISVLFGVRSNAILLGIVYIYDTLQFVSHFRFKDTFKALIAGFTIFLSLCHSIGSSYSEYCPDRGEWCFQPIPSLMYYAQSHYWNNGFLKYWTPNNIPNFLFMAPQFIIFIISIRYLYQNYQLRPIIIVSIIYLILNLFFWHVQIFNRVSTFIPLNYIYLGKLNSNHTTLLSIIIKFNIIWIIIQCGLYALFLPPA